MSVLACVRFAFSLYSARSSAAGLPSQGNTPKFVARASKLCREASHRPWEPADPVALKELRELLRTNENLPVVRIWREDATERARLRRSTAPGQRSTPQVRRAAFQRQVTIYNAERRLPGIGGCTESPYISL